MVCKESNYISLFHSLLRYYSLVDRSVDCLVGCYYLCLTKKYLICFVNTHAHANAGTYSIYTHPIRFTFMKTVPTTTTYNNDLNLKCVCPKYGISRIILVGSQCFFYSSSFLRAAGFMFVSTKPNLLTRFNTVVFLAFTLSYIHTISIFRTEHRLYLLFNNSFIFNLLCSHIILTYQHNKWNIGIK